MIKYLLLFALLAMPQGASVSGKILDRQGKPMANAQITYANAGQFSPGVSSGTDQSQSRIVLSGNGKVYKTKTNKKGEFLIVGVMSGIYQVDIADASGAHLFTGKVYVGDNGDATWSNVLNVDLSSPQPGDVVTREHNPLVDRMNNLTNDLHSALDNHDWPRAEDLLHQLIQLDGNRWEFYQNLGAVQSNMQKYAESAESFQKGIELEQKLLANKSDSAKIKSDLSGMMISEADALHRLGKLDQAMALYEQAAPLAPKPAMAFYHACNAQLNRGSATAAIELCEKAVAANPDQWEFYETLANAQNDSGKVEDAFKTYQSGIETAKRQLATDPGSAIVKAGLGQMLNAEGNMYSQHSRYEEAIGAFTEAAKFSSYAAMPLFNACATYYNMNRLTEAIAACDQAIASDPAMAEAYYLKGAALFGRGSLGHGKYQVPEGTSEIFYKYLELAPFGEHARDVRAMLDKLDAPIESSDKPSKSVKK